MSFAYPNADAGDSAPIKQLWWPDIHVDDARGIVRITGTVTPERLREALVNAVWSVNRELTAWQKAQPATSPNGLQDERLIGLYRRAVYFYAKAELAERYRDYDLTGAGKQKAEDMDSIADDARRNLRWAISDFLGVPRVTVEAL